MRGEWRTSRQQRTATGRNGLWDFIVSRTELLSIDDDDDDDDDEPRTDDDRHRDRNDDNARHAIICCPRFDDLRRSVSSERVYPAWEGSGPREWWW